MVKISVSSENDSSATHQTVQKSAAMSRKSLKKKTAPKSVAKVAPKAAAPKSVAKAKAKAALKTPKMPKMKAPKKVPMVEFEEEETNPKPLKSQHKTRRFILAIVCSAATVAGLAAFMHFNMPSISVKVAAMQSGMDATYPTYTPRGYQLTNVTSDKEGKITMIFTSQDGATFTLSEEKSTWDSNALLNNYVKKNYGGEYATLREQGITIYTAKGDAAWVNGGILYEITTTGHVLTKEQIRNLVVSL